MEIEIGQLMYNWNQYTLFVRATDSTESGLMGWGRQEGHSTVGKRAVLEPSHSAHGHTLCGLSVHDMYSRLF